MNDIHCVHCGQLHPVNAAFCPNTGQKLAQPVSAHASTAPPPPQPAYAQAASASPANYQAPATAAPVPPIYANPAPPYAVPPGFGQAVGGAVPAAVSAASFGAAAGTPARAPAVAPPGAAEPSNVVGGYGFPGAAPPAFSGAGFGGVRHAYPLAIRDATFSTALGLAMKTLPYAMARFGILLAVSIVTLIWYVVAFGGWALLGSKVHPAAGLVWFFSACAVYGWVWWLVVRYFLYLLKCGHIAVLTELMMKGRLDLGGQNMFAYGKDTVRRRFGEVNVLFVVDQLVKGVVRAFNRTLDFLAGLLPIPGLSSVMGLVNAVVYAATTYLDETIFSYGIARNETNPWASAKDGLIYYAQNSKEILKTSIWIVVLDKVLTTVIWLVMLVPAFVVAWIVPSSFIGVGWFAFGFAALLAGNIRAAFLKPILLIMVMAKFHVQIQNQPLNAEWDERLSRASNKFREISDKLGAYRPAPALSAKA